MRRSFLCLLALLALLMKPPQALATQIGPDHSYGYRAKDVNTPFEDISPDAGAIKVLADDDDAFTSVNLPFNFKFYGTVYTAGTPVFPSVNGLITFGSGTPEFSNVNLNTTAAAATPAIAVLWDDWTTKDQMNADALYYMTRGTGPNRRFIIQWNVVRGVGSATDPDAVTFEAVFFEGTSNIELRYKDVDTTDARNLGGSATVGVQAAGNSDRLQWSFNQPILFSGETILFLHDSDGDGVIDEQDCAPFDPAISSPVTYYRDADGDGFGDPASPLTVCSLTPPSGYVLNNTDCDDTHASVHPGAPEICDGLDNNCDGLVDNVIPGTQPLTYVRLDYTVPGPNTFTFPDSTTTPVIVGCNAFATIQAAIDATGAGGTVYVGPGLYTEAPIQVNKSVTLKGVFAGADSCYRTTNGSSIVQTGFDVTADNVTIDGFDIANTVETGRGGAGVNTYGGHSGCKILSNVFFNNVFGLYLNSNGAFPSLVSKNWFVANNTSGAASGDGIYSDQGLKNVTIDDNCFGGAGFAPHSSSAIVLIGTGVTTDNVKITNNDIINDNNIFMLNMSNVTISNNKILSSGTNRSGISVGGGNSGLKVSCNLIQNNNPGISITDSYSVGPNTTVTIDDNNIVGNATAGLKLDAGSYSGALTATGNHWNHTPPTRPGGPIAPNYDIVDPNNVVVTVSDDPAYKTCASAPVDQDADGVPLGFDCNDNDANIGGPRVYYQDADHDNFGATAIAVEACTAPAGFVLTPGDCNDNDPSVYPGAPELCDGKDNNCDGLIDNVTPGSQPVTYVDPTFTVPGPAIFTFPDATTKPVVVSCNAFATIQAAHDATAPGGTVYVASADTNEPTINISKSITLKGVHAGVTGCERYSGGSGIRHGMIVDADNVTIDGFDISYNTAGPGVELRPAHSGYKLLNNVIYGNVYGVYLHSSGSIPSLIDSNFIANNNAPGAASGNGIYSDQGLKNVKINDNCFGSDNPVVLPQANSAIILIGSPVVSATVSGIEITNNKILSDNRILLICAQDVEITGNAIVRSQLHGIQVDSGCKDITIKCNLIQAFSQSAPFTYAGVRIAHNYASYSALPSSNVTIQDNSIVGTGAADLKLSAGAYSGAAGSLIATNNYWYGTPTYTNLAVPNGFDIIDPDGKVTYSALGAASSCAPAVIDGDGDTVPLGIDCDDTNNTVGAPSFAWFRDRDADTFGSALSGMIMTCSNVSPGADYVPNNNDCDDNNPAIHPGATEILNGIDDNCNGTIDEGFPGSGSLTNVGVPVRSSPTAFNGVVYFGDDAGWLHAVNTTTRVQVWKTKLWKDPLGLVFDPVTDKIHSRPAVYSYSGDTFVYVMTTGGRLSKVRIADGHVMWTATPPGALFSPQIGNSIKNVSTPVVDPFDGTVIAGFNSDFSGPYLATFDNATGAPGVKTVSLGKKVGAITAPAMDANNLYIGVTNGTLVGDIFVLNAATLTVRASYANGENVTSPPLVVSSSMYLGTLAGNYYRLNSITAAPDPSFDLDGRLAIGQPLPSSPFAYRAPGIPTGQATYVGTGSIDLDVPGPQTSALSGNVWEVSYFGNKLQIFDDLGNNAIPGLAGYFDFANYYSPVFGAGSTFYQLNRTGYADVPVVVGGTVMTTPTLDPTPGLDYPYGRWLFGADDGSVYAVRVLRNGDPTP